MMTKTEQRLWSRVYADMLKYMRRLAVPHPEASASYAADDAVSILRSRIEHGIVVRNSTPDTHPLKPEKQP